MVEGARLESVYRGNSIEGSNPSLSAISHSGLNPVPGSLKLKRYCVSFVSCLYGAAAAGCLLFGET